MIAAPREAGLAADSNTTGTRGIQKVVALT